MEKVIFAVMGSSGSGKSTLILEMLRRFPKELAPMKSLTTRPKRSAEDDLAYRFVTREEFIALRDANGLVQYVEYDGNFYGDERSDIAAIFAAGKHGIRPMVADGIRNFRAAGFRVAVANVIPAGEGYKNRSSEREKIDAARARDPLLPDLDIENRFEAGGFEQTCASLETFIRAYIGGLSLR